MTAAVSAHLPQSGATSRVIFNLLMFQVIWWVSVVGHAHIQEGLLLLAVGLYFVWHSFALHHPLKQGWLSLLQLLVCALLGILADQGLYALDWVRFPQHTGAYIPEWMLALWLGFVTTLHVSLRWLQPKRLIAAALGLVFAPLTYYGAQQLGAVEFKHLGLALTGIALCWAVLLPLQLKLSSLD